LIYPGVTIGDHCIVSAAAVVMKDVPSNCVVAGNPGRVVETGIQTGPLGYKLKRPSVPALNPEVVKA
jgi:maltose O-acetyltransferase